MNQNVSLVLVIFIEENNQTFLSMPQSFCKKDERKKKIYF